MALKSEEVFWEWNVMEGKNPTHTGAFLNSYDHRDFSPEEVAARESGQNAMDAGSKIKKVTRLVFQELRAEGENKDRILDLLKIRDGLKPRLKVFSEGEGDIGFFDSLKNFLSPEPMRALLIRDYNTCGLGGALNRYEIEDHFSRLIYALNLDDKAGGDDNSGGSYGLGKTAYAKSSTINTVIYHSVFKETESTEGAYRRLMGAGVYPRHEFKGRKYGGYAYIGQRQSTKDAGPFENEKAEHLWNSLGEAFGVDLSRSEKQHGTDVLILMDNLDWKGLIRAIEDYYFPALHDNQLHVRFIDRNKKTTIPSVVKREDLLPFLDLYKKAGDGNAQKLKQQTLWTGNLARHQGYYIGSFAFQSTIVEEGEIDSDDDDSKTRNKRNRVAIMRGTGMVIDYVKMGSDQYEPAIGVFVAHKDIRDHLRIAENAAHSQWSEDSRRLAQQYPEVGKELVKRTNRVLMKNFRDFQKSLQPDVPKTRSDGGLLSRLLANILSGSKGNERIEKISNPVSLSLQSGGRSEEKSLWRLRIEDCEHTPDEEFELTLKPQISLAGDSKKIPIRHRDFIVRDQATGEVLSDEERLLIQRPFSKGKSLAFDIEIDNPGHKNYLVRCKCETESIKSGEQNG
ncbi:hypothetical protein [Thioalkalivibrio sp. HK1]|uniref:hypothetical protein n=1 Tax=Thioalkalivibrio sp. HK1 TaxID=1469245 RepID=UPI00047161F2|nr:hypothetical protein [Thioalkalivibrio sp. HK1]